MFVRFHYGAGYKSVHLLFAVCLLSLSASASAASLSYTGFLSSPESDAQFTFTLQSANTVTFQTWGFGGGINAAGQIIPAGGFDPLIALFSGSTAAIVTDGLGDPYADADNLVNGPSADPTAISFVGNCPPAGTVAIGVNSDCGDDFMLVHLSAGTYTISLSDASYVPAAVYDNGTLGEGFIDLTGGAFQTCDSTDGSCITPDASYALDIVSPGLTPEPSAWSLLGIGLAALAGMKQLKKRRETPNSIGGNI